jgi:hypothetical protein
MSSGQRHQTLPNPKQQTTIRPRAANPSLVPSQPHCQNPPHPHTSTPFLPSSRCVMRRLKNPALRLRHHHHCLLYNPFFLKLQPCRYARTPSLLLPPRLPSWCHVARAHKMRAQAAAAKQAKQTVQHSRIADRTGEVSSRKCVWQ